MSEAPRTVEMNGHTYTRIDLLDHVIVNGQFYVKPHFPGGEPATVTDKEGDTWYAVEGEPGKYRLRNGSLLCSLDMIRLNYGIKEEG